MRNLRFLAIAALFICFAALPSVARAAKKTQVLYAANGSGGGHIPDPGPTSLLELDRGSGEVSREIGEVGFAVTGLAIHPKTKQLYGVTGAQNPPNPGSLIKINKATGKGTLIGDEIEGTDQGAADITFTSDGTLYGWSEEDDALVTIDITTGEATIVADLGEGTNGSGLSASGNDTLFFVGDGDMGPLSIVNKTTGALTTVATLDGTFGESINALAFDRKDNLFGSRKTTDDLSRDLIRIDTETGHITSVGESIDRLDALEFSEPHEACKGAKANVLGTSKKDGLKGTKGRDLVAGGRGNDRLNGRRGKDCVAGEGGKDKVSGGGGKDKLTGGGGRDTLKSADGATDKVDCGGGKDSATVDPDDKVRRCEEVRVT
jgi:Ca2+-binding RTX toxin-like protein